MKNYQNIEIIIIIIIIIIIRELKKLRNMKVTVIPMIVGALGTVPKSLVERVKELEIKERIETIPTTTLLRLARRVLECRGYLLSLRIQFKKHQR